MGFPLDLWDLHTIAMDAIRFVDVIFPAISQGRHFQVDKTCQSKV